MFNSREGPVASRPISGTLDARLSIPKRHGCKERAKVRRRNHCGVALPNIALSPVAVVAHTTNNEIAIAFGNPVRIRNTRALHFEGTDAELEMQRIPVHWVLQ